MSFFFVNAVNDDLVKDCLSVLYNCCICVSTVFHSVICSPHISTMAFFFFK